MLDNAMQVASKHPRQHIASCDDPAKVVRQSARARCSYDLGNHEARRFERGHADRARQDAGPGETTAPFLSPAGVELIVRCDKASP